jgi:hypothetical protein
LFSTQVSLQHLKKDKIFLSINNQSASQSVSQSVNQWCKSLEPGPVMSVVVMFRQHGGR